ncbi:MAG: anaerobic ribonucleoside-triphosphate reductase [Thermoproteota archaeon]|nr:anaerobic ribonucleoside-triphosphate reductase [Thermoproteota archaeon]
MSQYRPRSVKILKAVSSPTRLRILSVLFDYGSLSYTQIMNKLQLSSARNAGRFAYHLKSLLKTDLVEPDLETKKYRLTELGRMALHMAEEMEKHAFERRKMFVRTSRLSIEEFDRNKITESLIKEADVPTQLAQKIAREAEKRLQKFKTKYLTAPLIREIVNTILVEKRLEQYRHKLTRLGLPVHDVTQLIKETGAKSLNVEAVHRAAGDAVIGEYTLLNVLPRVVADAHMSGTLHLNNLGRWILKPNEFVHDLRFFLKYGLTLRKNGFLGGVTFHPPKTFESALLMISRLLKIAATEISGEQTLDFFNVFLAPFVKGMSFNEIKKELHVFLFDLNQASTHQGFPIPTSLELELVIPDFLEKKVVEPGGKVGDCYADFAKESQLVAQALMDLMKNNQPLFNPSVIIKLRPGTFENSYCEKLLLQSHQLAAEKGLPYFANLFFEGQKYASYTATGRRLSADWKGDWELDTLRTGNVENVLINLPRISYDAKRNRSKFFEFLDDRLEMALQALKIKCQVIEQRAKEGLLPFLTHRAEGDRYARLENSLRLVSFVGLNEAVQSFCGKAVHEDGLHLAEEIVKHSSVKVQERSKSSEVRMASSMSSNIDVSRRLAELDVDRYGWEKVHTLGNKEHPFYTDGFAVPLETHIPWEERLRIEEKFHQLCQGGHLAVLQLADIEQNPEELLAVTRQIVTKYKVGLYAYNRNLSYCSHCQNVSYGILSKCPSCGSVDSLQRFSRVSAKYGLTSFLAPTQQAAVGKRVSYVLISK